MNIPSFYPSLTNNTTFTLYRSFLNVLFEPGDYFTVQEEKPITMFKKILFFLAVSAFSHSGYAQTKLIAHRSHSGSDQNFSLESPDNLGNIDPKFYPEVMPKLEEAEKKEEERKKAEALRQAELEKQKKMEAEKLKQIELEKQKQLETEKRNQLVKDSTEKVKREKFVKDSTAKVHKRQYYSPYGLPINKSPKPEAAGHLTSPRFKTSGRSLEADFSFAAWLLISAAALSWFTVRKTR